MLVKKSFITSALLVMVLSFAGISSALAGDPSPTPTPTLQEPDTLYEPNLFKDNKDYPDVELRKEFRPDCSCVGGYFGFNGGYSYGEARGFAKGIPVVVNPGALNEALPAFAITGEQYNASLSAGYKFSNLRAEVSGEYKRFEALPIASSVGGVVIDISTNTEQFGAIMSGYYDFDIDGSPITPYLGLGAGVTNSNTSYNLAYTAGGSTTTGALNYSKGLGVTGAAMAGVALQVSDNIVFDIGYRYVNAFGSEAQFESSVNAAAINTATGINMINSGMGVDTVAFPNVTETLIYPDIITHEVRLGIRYKF